MGVYPDGGPQTGPSLVNPPSGPPPWKKYVPGPFGPRQEANTGFHEGLTPCFKGSHGKVLKQLGEWATQIPKPMNSEANMPGLP